MLKAGAGKHLKNRGYAYRRKCQLELVRDTLKVTAEMHIDATMSEPASIISTTAAVLAAV